MIESVIEFCARRRGLVLFAFGVALFGAAIAIRRIKIDAIPDLSDPQVIIFTEWMGRSPTLVEDQVTYPIVSKLVSTPKVTGVRGYSMFGMSFVHIVFEEGTDVYWARSRVMEYLAGLRGNLPEGATPTLGPDATGVGWVFQYALVDKSGRTGLDELRAFQDFTLRYALGSVPGVAEVASVGGYQKQYQVTVDPDRLRALGVTLDEVIQSIRASNNDVGGRVVEMSGREYFVRGRGYIRDLASIENIALRGTGPGGAPVLVKHVGSVRFGPDIRRGLLEWNGEGEAVGGIVVMRQGENARDVIARVKQKIADLRPGFPAGVELHPAYDRSGLIDRSIDTLKHALFEETVTVSLVIILFLLHFRSSLLPILTLPISVALSFIPMWFFGIPSTIMSLGGIAIAIGATVDAEIVMIEASHRKLEHAAPGADRHRILAEAAREVTPAIFFSLLIIAVAFLPVFTLTGQAGRLFRPLAFTKTFVMLISALMSITFAPALRDLLIRGRIRPERNHPVSRFLKRLYEPLVYVALRRPKSTIAIGLLATISAIPPALRLGHEFMPPLDEGDLLYMPITMPNVSIEEAKRALQRQDRVLKSFPEVESVWGKIGRSDSPTDPAPITMVETTARLKPQSQWRKGLTFADLTAEMNAKMQFPGWTNAWTMPVKTRIDMLTTGVRTPVGVKVLGSSLEEIEKIGIALERVLTPIRGTRSVLYERNLGGLYLDIVPRPVDLARYGLRVADVQRVIESAIGGAPIGVTIEGRKRFSINVRYPQDQRSDVEAIRRILVPTGSRPPGAQTPGAMPMPTFGSWRNEQGESRTVLAQAMSDPAARGGTENGVDAQHDPMRRISDAGGGLAPLTQPVRGGTGAGGRTFVPLGQIADVRIVGGPPMVRDEDGQLVGYVYVDVDERTRDLGGYVDEAKRVVAGALAAGTLTLPEAYHLKWTGQYEQLAEMRARMKLVLPLTLFIIIGLLYLQFRSATQVGIVLLSIPFALVGSVWLLALLDYRLSTAVWVGMIALVGLAAQTGVVMIVYINNAVAQRREADRLHGPDDLLAAVMEGTVQRVRPKIMTVAAMLLGLLPLLWATGTGADVMKRIAAPMVGGLLTSAFLTLEIIPVIYFTIYRRVLFGARAA